MPTPSNNLYLHVDGDAFFVACELSTQPQYIGLPVIVGADRGIAVAMSPEAKALGVTRGMPVFQIKRDMPEVIILNHNFHLYEDISLKMYKILSEYFSRVERYSIDECFAIVKPSDVKFFKGADKMMEALRIEVEAELGVSYSYGLARTKALAKQASKINKPRGLAMLFSKEDEENALKKTKIEDVWGIGGQTYPRLQRLGIKTAYDFVKYPTIELGKTFSSSVYALKRELGGEELLDVEDRVDPRGQKSIQSTATFRPSSTEEKVIARELSKNVERACTEARALGLVARKISFFVKNSDFKYHTGEVKLKIYTSDPGAVLTAIRPEIPKLLRSNETIRSTGVTLSSLIREEDSPLDLFGEQDRALGKLIIEKTADRIRGKYGKDAIKRISSL